MASYYTTVTYYIAPSKERNPLVRQLLSEDKFTRRDGFLTASYSVDDSNRSRKPPSYAQLCELGYISEDHRTTGHCSNGDAHSDWYDFVGRTRYKIGTKIEHRIHDWGNDDDEHDARREKENLRLFWLAFPNLMFIIKHGRPPTSEELARESRQQLSEEQQLDYPNSSLSANLTHAEYKSGSTKPH